MPGAFTDGTQYEIGAGAYPCACGGGALVILVWICGFGVRVLGLGFKVFGLPCLRRPQCCTPSLRCTPCVVLLGFSRGLV